MLRKQIRVVGCLKFRSKPASILTLREHGTVETHSNHFAKKTGEQHRLVSQDNDWQRRKPACNIRGVLCVIRFAPSIESGTLSQSRHGMVHAPGRNMHTYTG